MVIKSSRHSYSALLLEESVQKKGDYGIPIVPNVYPTVSQQTERVRQWLVVVVF